MRLVPWMPPLFADRAAGGRVLAAALAATRLDRPVVVGVARGGVAVAAVVAGELAAPLTAVDVERVNAGGRRWGATTAEGPPYLSQDSTSAIDGVLERARREAAAMDARLGAKPPAFRDRTVVIVDDGVISGLTLAAACRWARAHDARRVVAATPVGHVDGLARAAGEADAVVCPHALEQIAVVGQAYDSFDPLDEWYVAGLLAGVSRPETG